MKVKVEVVLDINIDMWKLAYGLETNEEVRADVKAHLPGILDDWLTNQSLGSVRS